GIYVTPDSFPIADLKVTANSIEGQCEWAMYADAGSYGIFFTTVTGNEITSWGGGIKFGGDTNSVGLTMTGNFVAFNTSTTTKASTGVHVGTGYRNVAIMSNVLVGASNSVGYDVRASFGTIITGHIIDVPTMFAPTNVTIIQGGAHQHAGLPTSVAAGSYVT